MSIVITVAPTGPIATKADNPALPTSPEEIATAVEQAYHAGAAVAHIHLRDENERPTADPNIARRAMDLIGERCPILIQLSTGVGLTVPFEQREQLVELRPRMATLNPCSMSFGAGEFRNPPQAVRRLAARMRELDIKPELEIYDTGHLEACLRLWAEDLLAEPLQFSFVLGVRGGMAATADNLLTMVRRLPPGAIWQVIAIGKANMELTAMGLALGGNASAWRTPCTCARASWRRAIWRWYRARYVSPKPWTCRSPRSKKPRRRCSCPARPERSSLVSAEEQDTRSGGIQVIARAAELLRVLQAHPGGLSQAEIGERVGMARSTVSRILNALEDEGLVASRRARGPYRLGPEITRMATTVRLGVVTEMHPFLTELSRELDETVDLSILDGDRADVVDQVVPPQRLRAVSAVGESFPLYCCANGKALLAALPPERQARALPSRLAPLTANTITDRAALRDELNRIRVDGVAYDREEQTEGICAVGAVLRGVSVELVAVSVPVPAQRFYGREAELAGALLAWVSKVDAWFNGTEDRK